MASYSSDDQSPPERRTILRHLKARASAKYMPRLAMCLIMTVVLGVIFFSSKVMLEFGLQTMWLRYLAADGIGYAVFILLLWVWTHFEGFTDADCFDIPYDSGSGGGCGSSGGSEVAAEGSSWLGALDLEGAAFLLIVVLAAAVVFITAYNIWLAPEILAELMLDAGFAGLLSKRAKGIKPEGFLNSALRKTFWPFAGFTAVMTIVALIISAKYPEAHSLAQAIHLWHGK